MICIWISTWYLVYFVGGIFGYVETCEQSWELLWLVSPHQENFYHESNSAIDTNIGTIPPPTKKEVQKGRQKNNLFIVHDPLIKTGVQVYFKCKLIESTKVLKLFVHLTFDLQTYKMAWDISHFLVGKGESKVTCTIRSYVFLTLYTFEIQHLTHTWDLPIFPFTHR